MITPNPDSKLTGHEPGCHCQACYREIVHDRNVFRALWNGAAEVAKGDPVQTIHRLRQQLATTTAERDDAVKRLVQQEANTQKPPGCSELLRGLTDNEMWDCWEAAAAGWIGRDCQNSFAEMLVLKDKGLVENLNQLPGRGRHADRYQFTMTADGEAVAAEVQQTLVTPDQGISLPSKSSPAPGKAPAVDLHK